MADNASIPPARSYGCSFGCGNPYDYIVVSVADSDTQLLCLPCFVRVATDMVAAVTNPDDPKVQAAIAEAEQFASTPMTGDGVKARGHNAPAANDDDDLIEAYSSVITEDELPEEFR